MFYEDVWSVLVLSMNVYLNFVVCQIVTLVICKTAGDVICFEVTTDVA